MSTMNVNINLDEIQQKIRALSPEEIKTQLLEIRTKQRIQQKKYQNTDAAIKYRKQRAEFQKMLAKAAKESGVYDQILAEAERRANEVLNLEPAEEDEAEQETL